MSSKVGGIARAPVWGANLSYRMGMIRQLNMQKRDTSECLFQAMDEKARLAALILCDTSFAVPSLDPRSLTHFQLLLSFDVSKYSVLSTIKRRLSSAKNGFTRVDDSW